MKAYNLDVKFDDPGRRDLNGWSIKGYIVLCGSCVFVWGGGCLCVLKFKGGIKLDL